jgi:hypothetical protein
VVATASGSWEGIHGEGGMTTYDTEGGKHWTVHTFTQSGTLRVSGAGEVEYLMVGGGGDGGSCGAYGALYVPAKGGNGGSGIVIVRSVTGRR